MNKERLPNICWEARFLSRLCKFPFLTCERNEINAIYKLLQIAKGILFSRSQFQRFLFHVHPDALGNKSNLINIFFEISGENPTIIYVMYYKRIWKGMLQRFVEQFFC